MTPILFALAAAVQAAPADSAEAQLRSCIVLIKESPEKAIAAADAWRLKGGSLDARHCLGLAFVAAERWAPAATAFDQAAREAETKKDARAADFWTQSGNAWLAGGDPAQAIKAFDAALAVPALQAELRGEVHLDRARAAVALGDLARARPDLDQAIELAAVDPMAWYLSAVLARKQDDLGRAQKDIAKAVELAPKEPMILLEAGNIAGITGDVPGAKAFYARAAQGDPDGPVGRAAAAALAANGAPEEPAPAAPPATAKPKAPAPQAR